MVNEKEKQDEPTENQYEKIPKDQKNNEDKADVSDVPKTGDESGYEMYLLILLLSIALLIKMCYHNFRLRK